MSTYDLIVGDCRAELDRLPAGSVHTIITSPPYYGLRDYGHDGQIGLEPTVEGYVNELVDVMRAARRVLRDDGTLWLNLGDSYAGSWGAQGRRPDEAAGVSAMQITNHPKRASHTGTIRDAGLKPKDLIGVPWRVAFALQADGWTLRSDVIWSKPNPMPESVTDRPTKAHEYLFLLAKSPRYYYDADAIREPDSGPTGGRQRAALNGDDRYRGTTQRAPEQDHARDGALDTTHYTGRNRRTVWTVPTRPYAGAHFATFPPDLIEPCVLAGAPRQACGQCGAPYQRITERALVPDGTGRYRPEQRNDERDTGLTPHAGHRGAIAITTIGHAPSCDHNADPVPGRVLDPFNGAGTTGLVALQHGRHYTGIELNPAYADLARGRLDTAIRLGHRPPERARPVHTEQAALDLFTEATG